MYVGMTTCGQAIRFRSGQRQKAQQALFRRNLRVPQASCGSFRADRIDK